MRRYIYTRWHVNLVNKASRENQLWEHSCLRPIYLHFIPTPLLYPQTLYVNLCAFFFLLFFLFFLFYFLLSIHMQNQIRHRLFSQPSIYLQPWKRIPGNRAKRYQGLDTWISKYLKIRAKENKGEEARTQTESHIVHKKLVKRVWHRFCDQNLLLSQDIGKRSPE